MSFDSNTPTPEFERNFAPLSEPSSFSLGSGGLKLFLDKPAGKVKTTGNVNDKVGDGATFNSTFTVRYAKVTFSYSAPAVAGVVSAAILIAPEMDEIDIELLGGDTSHWQTNVFSPAPGETQPLYSAFNTIQTYPYKPKTVSTVHSYTIDWSPERIVWSVDDFQVRTLHKDDTERNGALHFPTHVSRLQFGIWDASAPDGTSRWARGPIDWSKAPKRMSAVFKSIKVECPY